MPAITPGLRTTDASFVDYPVTGPGFPADSVSKVTLFVFATDHVGGAAAWWIRVAAYRVADGVVQGVAEITKQSSLGGATWTINVVFTAGDVRVQVKGGLLQTVDWGLTNEERFGIDGTYA